MRAAIEPMVRCIVTPEVSKHRIFAWLNKPILPDCQLMVIARDDDTAFGILHSRFHEAWSLALGTALEDRPRYTPSTIFETFPFPPGLTPNLPATSYADNPHAQAIAAAAQALVARRDHWLNPPELVTRTPEVVPGFPDRLLPRGATAAKTLSKRTLTALYNTRGKAEGPGWTASTPPWTPQSPPPTAGPPTCPTPRCWPGCWRSTTPAPPHLDALGLLRSRRRRHLFGNTRRGNTLQQRVRWNTPLAMQAGGLRQGQAALSPQHLRRPRP